MSDTHKSWCSIFDPVMECDCWVESTYEKMKNAIIKQHRLIDKYATALEQIQRELTQGDPHYRTRNIQAILDQADIRGR